MKKTIVDKRKLFSCNESQNSMVVLPGSIFICDKTGVTDGECNSKKKFLVLLVELNSKMKSLPQSKNH